MAAPPRRTALRIDDPAEDVPRLITGGSRSRGVEWGLVLRPTEARGVLVLVRKEGTICWRGDDAGDAVAMPGEPMELEVGVSTLKEARKGIARRTGPITLRGRWKGSLHFAEEGPYVVFDRKVAPYTRLVVEASPETGGWAWRLDREARWFTGAGTTAGAAVTLRQAIEQAALALEGIVGEACTTRDTRRRGAYDTDYTGKAGASAPVGPGRRGKDVLEWAPRPPGTGRRRKAAPPPALDAPATLPDPPATPAAMKRLEQEVAAEADALAGLRSRRWVWEESDVAAEVQQWFAENGLDHEAGEVASFVLKPWDGATFLTDLRQSLDSEAPPLRQEALAQVDRLEAWWVEAPQLVARARTLIRYAARMVESPLCRGREKQEAAAALDRAVLAYDAVRDALAAGQAIDGVMELRRIGERVALTAAKAARTCGRGQRSLTAAIAAPAAVASGGWKAGDRFVVEGGREGTVVGVPSEGSRRVEVEWDVPVELGPGESVRRQRLRVDAMLDPETGRRRPMQLALPVRAAKPAGRVDTTTVPGLTIVDVGTVPTTAAELRALTVGHAEAFEAEPKASTAKKWVRSALLHLGLEAGKVSARTQDFSGVGGRKTVEVTVELGAATDRDDVRRKMRLLSKAAPRDLKVEGGRAPGAAALKPSVRSAGRRANPAGPPPSAEPEVDAEKDKALLDAFSAAIAAAMAG